MFGSPVTQSIEPPREAWTDVQDFAGGSSAVYVGKAKGLQPSYTYTVTSVSTASSAVVTITAHGLQDDNAVVIAGATGDWAACNGTQKITRTGADTFTIAVNSSAFSGTFNGTVTTTAPRTSAAVWSIQKLYYSSSNMVRVSYASGTSAPDKVWDNRASLMYQ